MNSHQYGFTLIELMVVVAIIGIISSIAIPAYQDYIIRTRVVEGVSIISEPKLFIASDATTAADLNATASSWNARAGGKGATTKFVTSVLLNTKGEIVVTYNNNVAPAVDGKTLVFTPYIQRGGAAATPLATALLTGGVTGNIDWGCASDTNSFGTMNGLPTLTNATLPAKYAPGQCR